MGRVGDRIDNMESNHQKNARRKDLGGQFKEDKSNNNKLFYSDPGHIHAAS